MASDGQKRLKILHSQTYGIKNAIAAVVGGVWTDVLAIPMGELKPGDAMTCFCGIFLDFQGGKIVAQRNYDCFPPF